jgi:phage tail-like protein
MSTVDLDTPSSYLQYLPGIFQPDSATGAFLGRYLKIFEKILTGIDDGAGLGGVPIEGIEQVVNRLYGFFDPETAPREFLDWLAGWMALALREDWDEPSKRRLLRRIIPLYGKRGTKSGLAAYLKIFVGSNVQLDEFLSGITVGLTGSVGIDTFVGGLLPHFFIVTITFDTIISLGFIQDTVTATKSVLDLEKPAHTYYALRFDMPGITVGERSTVGNDTIIGRSYPFFV